MTTFTTNNSFTPRSQCFLVSCKTISCIRNKAVMATNETFLDKKKDDLSDDDIAHMKKVAGYVHRHLAQKPRGDVKDTPWRYSLMNWGHDPLKDK